MIFVLIVLLGIIIYCIIRHYEVKLKKEKSKISFKESVDLINLPVVTLINNNEKFNFLLDTGSTDSHVSEKASGYITGERMEYKMNMIDYSSTGDMTGIAIKAFLGYKNKEYESLLHVSSHLDRAFKDIKAQQGVQLHGILGSDFLQKHKYVLDFAELIAYSK